MSKVARLKPQMKNGMATTKMVGTRVNSNAALVTATNLRFMDHS